MWLHDQEPEQIALKAGKSSKNQDVNPHLQQQGCLSSARCSLANSSSVARQAIGPEPIFLRPAAESRQCANPTDHDSCEPDRLTLPTMSAAAGGSTQNAVVIASSQKSEKKHKRTKSDKKKRAREDDDAAVVEETPRKSKKTKSEDVTDDTQEAQLDQPQTTADEPSKKKKKKQRAPEDEEGQHGVAAAGGPKKERKKSSKPAKEVNQPDPERMDVDQPEEVHRSEKKRKDKKSKKQKSEEDEEMKEDLAVPDAEAQEKKKRKSKDKSKDSSGADSTASQEAQASQDAVADLPSNSDFPFFTQTVSLYVPFFPVGFDKPLTNVAAQHLDPLLNHYSPVLRGVLLSYSNLNLSDRPAKASVTHPPTDETPALLHSIDEYAVGFGWLTFDAQLFVPSRGKWMEGVVQLQSEGHIGVVCWNKFNASIEAKRLPKGWKWVDLAKSGTKQNNSSSSDENDGEEPGQEEESDMLDGEELQVVEQIHTTGYWVNERGRKVSGKLRFRIKNFDVGLAGDYGYLSIEGTCLDDDTERALAAHEREMERVRRTKQNPAGLLRPLSRRVPEFSMTRFGREDQEEDGGQRTVLYKGSRPGTPDD
jgi:DNA-directed RNA polymerase I subunit RPA43